MNSLSIVPFKYKYFQDLVDMLRAQDCLWTASVSYKSLPKTGYVALLDNTPVAMGFLRKVEGGYGQLDTFATHPAFGSILRHNAIVLITDHLISDAKAQGMTGILVISEHKTIVERAKALDFVVIPQTLLVKPI